MYSSAQYLPLFQVSRHGSAGCRSGPLGGCSITPCNDRVWFVVDWPCRTPAGCKQRHGRPREVAMGPRSRSGGQLLWHLADHRGTVHLARLRPDGWPPQPRDQVLPRLGGRRYWPPRAVSSPSRRSDGESRLLLSGERGRLRRGRTDTRLGRTGAAGIAGHLTPAPGANAGVWHPATLTTGSRPKRKRAARRPALSLVGDCGRLVRLLSRDASRAPEEASGGGAVRIAQPTSASVRRHAGSRTRQSHRIPR